MTGADDAAAAEAAELEALRQGAERRRKELGDTLDALTAKLAEDMDLASWARRGAHRATAGLGRATASAARHALPGPDGAAAGALQRARTSQHTRTVLVAGSAGLVLAVTAWWALSRRAHQRGMARRGLRAARWAVPAIATARRARCRARRGR